MSVYLTFSLAALYSQQLHFTGSSFHNFEILNRSIILSVSGFNCHLQYFRTHPAVVEYDDSCFACYVTAFCVTVTSFLVAVFRYTTNIIFKEMKDSVSPYQ